MELDGATYLSQMELYGGGVGRNIAEGIAKLYGKVNLISAVGNDQNGDFLRNLLPQSCAHGIVIDQEKPTANCAVIFDKPGDCKLVLGDMRIHSSITPATIQKHEELFKKSSIIVFDSNTTLETMTSILAKATKYNKTVFFEPTDMRIAGKPFELPLLSINCIKFISPNLYELRSIAKALGYPDKILNSKEDTDDLQAILSEVVTLSKFINTTVDNIIVTLGRFGVIVARRTSTPIEFFTKSQNYIELSKEKKISARFYPTKPITDIQNVSGAGDSFSSGFITAMLNGSTEDICVSVGFEAAKKSLQSAGAVPKMYFQQNHKCWRQKTKFIELL